MEVNISMRLFGSDAPIRSGWQIAPFSIGDPFTDAGIYIMAIYAREQKVNSI